MNCRHYLLTLLAGALISANGAAIAASKCALMRIEEWPVRNVRNHVIADGTINGQKVGVMLDTGASLSIILRSAATRLELPRQDARGVRLFGVGGETRVEVALIEQFGVGQTTLKDVRLFVAGEGDFDTGIEVILGEDFLSKFDVEFDLQHRAVRLFQATDCDGASLAYWTKEAVGEVAIDPLSAAHPQILLPVQVNGRPVQAQLDSGAWASVLNKRDAAEIGLTPESPGVVAAGGGRGLGANQVEVWIGPIQSFAIGNETIRDTRIHFQDIYKDMKYTRTGSNVQRSVSSLQPMLLGVDFLGTHRVLVAHSQRKIYFSYLGGQVFRAARLPDPATAGTGGPTPPASVEK